VGCHKLWELSAQIAGVNKKQKENPKKSQQKLTYSMIQGNE